MPIGLGYGSAAERSPHTQEAADSVPGTTRTNVTGENMCTAYVVLLRGISAHAASIFALSLNETVPVVSLE